MQVLSWPGSVLSSLACVLLMISGMARSQDGRAAPPALPPSVVLVLKLVSRDFVKPTTGIVISADGQVLVPADFVHQGDEIVVLDGGTDIIRNGRPAKTIGRSSTDGLAVLKVEGLQRAAAVLSRTDSGDVGRLHFAAFPAAEKIADGAMPLWLPVTLGPEGSSVTIEFATQRPPSEVSGALFDRCGHLAGYRPATLEQGSPGLLLAARVARVLDAMQVSYTRGGCATPAATASGERPVPPKPSAKAPTGISDSGQSGAGTGSQPTSPETLLAQPSAQPDNGTVNAVSPDTDVGVAEQQHRDRRKNFLWLILVIVAVLIWRARRKAAAGPPRQDPLHGTEPLTAELGTSPPISLRQPSDEPDDKVDIPDLDDLGENYTGMVLLEGSLADGRPVCGYCGIDDQPIDIVIGRRQTGLRLPAAAVSRAHARLQGAPEELTITDLGSSNGTFVGGIPCLPGETMYVSPDDEILLGDVRIRLCLQMKPGAGG